MLSDCVARGSADRPKERGRKIPNAAQRVRSEKRSERAGVESNSVIDRSIVADVLAPCVERMAGKRR
jgi:hypothetical protein